MTTGRSRAASGASVRREARTGRARLFAMLPALLLLVAGPPPAANAQVAPDAEWRVFTTPHFRVTFTPELEPLARRAGERAEEAHALLSDLFLPPPAGLIDIVVADHVDAANGLASPLPRNRMVLYATPPTAVASLAYFDDWLHLLVLHELVHVFHLDHARGLWQVGRDLLGRDPSLFPQAFTTGWLIEGLATWFESEYTGGGRVSGSYGEMIVRTAILEDAFFPIDRATMDPIAWPAGTTRYIYGAFFVDHLLRVHGIERFNAFLEEVGGRIVPYRLDAAARKVFGTSFTREWDEWEAALRTQYGAVADSIATLGVTQPELLTTAGRGAYHPRFAPGGEGILFAEGSGRRDASLRLLTPAGRNDFVVRRSSLGPASWLGSEGALLYSDPDFAKPHRIFNDLIVRPPATAARRVTEGARFAEADAHPHGDRAVAVASASGTNVLAVVDLATGQARPLSPPDLDLHWSAPRWSPDGSAIAAVRWRTGGLVEVVVLDEDGQIVRRVTTGRSVDSAPAWSPDGRYLLFSSDRTGISNLHAFDLTEGTLHQVTNVLTGAFEPDVSPDGAWIAFSYYRSDGYHIARIPFDPASWMPADGPDRGPTGRFSAGEPAAVGTPTRGYSPWPSVLPTTWSPILASDDTGTGVGAAIAGQDLVQRHLWAMDVTGYPTGRRLDAGAVYLYQGFGSPTLTLLAEQRWDVQGLAGEGAGSLPTLLRRERRLAGTLSFPRPGWRTSLRLDVGVDLRDRALRWSETPPEDIEVRQTFPLDLGASAAFVASTARGFALSLGRQEGATLGTRIEARRYLGDDALTMADPHYWRATARTTLFQSVELGGFAPWVFALRADGGRESSAAGPGFGVGGAGTAASVPSLTPRRTASLPVRGFSSGTQRGSRAASASFEVRLPIAMVERGYRLAPLALRRLSANAFVDAGAAWCPSGCASAVPTAPDPLLAAGAEAIIDLRVGYHLELPLRFGVAFPLRGPANTPAFHIRTGYAF